MKEPKVIAFDLFGTVFDMSMAAREDVKAYAQHLKKPKWSPLKLPDYWERFPAFPDSEDGINRLRKYYKVVTCSNAPMPLQVTLSKSNGISWDAIIPLEYNKVYKTNPKAYLTVCELLDVNPEDVMMVTANESFGDLEASTALGMRAELIRGNSVFPTIGSLASYFGA